LALGTIESVGSKPGRFRPGIDGRGDAGDTLLFGASIARGIAFSVTTTLAVAHWEAARRVIDVSDDGPDNNGFWTGGVEAAQDRAAASRSQAGQHCRAVSQLSADKIDPGERQDACHRSHHSHFFGARGAAAR
jgi:hypothetical protein